MQLIMLVLIKVKVIASQNRSDFSLKIWLKALLPLTNLKRFFRGGLWIPVSCPNVNWECRNGLTLPRAPIRLGAFALQIAGF